MGMEAVRLPNALAAANAVELADQLFFLVMRRNGDQFRLGGWHGFGLRFGLGVDVQIADGFGGRFHALRQLEDVFGGLGRGRRFWLRFRLGQRGDMFRLRRSQRLGLAFSGRGVVFGDDATDGG